MATIPDIDARQPPAPAAAPKAAAESLPAPAVANRRASVLTAPVIAVVLAMAGIVAVHSGTAASIVAIWWRSETFAHGFVVVPLFMWLVWNQRDVLQSTAAKPWWPGLAAVLLAGAFWFVTSAGGVLGLSQFGLLFMLEAAFVTVVGLRVARQLLFPLAFLVFAVPFGEIFVPTLIDWTANFVVWALRVSGVPVYREANHFVIPSGSWSVVEACSGIRYIIASLMIGTLYAMMAYRSARRRLLFIAAALAVPIVANWLRAYIIVMLGHLSDNRIAVGVDHLIYGWIFFGVVMLLLFWVGSLWQETKPPAAEEGVARGDGDPSPQVVPAARFFAAAAGCIIAAALWVPLAAGVQRASAPAAPGTFALAVPAGWTEVALPMTDWRPRYRGFVYDDMRVFERDGQTAGLYIAYYRHQARGHELVTSANQLATPEDVRWKTLSQTMAPVAWGTGEVDAEWTILAGTDARLDVVRMYWVDGRMTGSPYVAKALQAWSRITGRGDDAALVVLFAVRNDRGDGARMIDGFGRAAAPAIERALAASRAEGR